MRLQLIKGNFEKREALSLLTQLITVKLNFHEQKIENTQSEEDIKHRESRIKELQNELTNIRKLIEVAPEKIVLDAFIELPGQ